MIVERAVLLRIKHLQQSGCGIAPEIRTDLVDLIQHEHGIGNPGFFEPLQDASRQSSEIRPAVSADLRLVFHPAERHAYKLAPHRIGNGFSKRRFADSRRPRKAEDRRLLVFFQLQDRKEFQNPLLDVFEPEMVLVENPFRFGDVKPVFGVGLPWKRKNPVNVIVSNRIFPRRLRDHVQPLRLLFDGFNHMQRSIQFGKPFLDRYDVGILGLLAEFLLDGA